jgi:regulatory protein
MDRKELEESSSSPNVNLFITDLRKRGTREETVKVSLSDGSSFFIPSAWGERFRKGTPVGGEDLEEIRRTDLYIRCKEWAADFLASREESSGRLIRKMITRGYDRSTGLRVLGEMQDLGFQDDFRFAEQWLTSRMRKHPESRSHLEAGLVQRGVDRDLAHRAVFELVSTEDEEDMLRRCIRKFVPEGTAAGEKDVRRILRRGFSYSAIKRNLVHDN